jgi:hypothetical protein
VVAQEQGAWQRVLFRVPIRLPLQRDRLKPIGRIAAGAAGWRGWSADVHTLEYLKSPQIVRRIIQTTGLLYASLTLARKEGGKRGLLPFRGVLSCGRIWKQHSGWSGPNRAKCRKLGHLLCRRGPSLSSLMPKAVPNDSQPGQAVAGCRPRSIQTRNHKQQCQ